MHITFEAADHRGIPYIFRGEYNRVTPISAPSITEVFVKTGLGDLPITDEQTRVKVISHFTDAILTYAKSIADQATVEA